MIRYTLANHDIGNAIVVFRDRSGLKGTLLLFHNAAQPITHPNSASHSIAASSPNDASKASYEQTKRAMQEVVDLPDRDIDLFIRLCLQNQGKLSKSERDSTFRALNDDEVARLEQCVADGYGAEMLTRSGVDAFESRFQPGIFQSKHNSVMLAEVEQSAAKGPRQSLSGLAARYGVSVSMCRRLLAEHFGARIEFRRGRSGGIVLRPH